MMKLIQNIDIYATQYLGKKDVLTINDKIVKIKDAGSISADGFLSEAANNCCYSKLRNSFHSCFRSTIGKSTFATASKYMNVAINESRS